MWQSTSLLPTVHLSSGYNMPVVGLGTWRAEKGAAETAVYSALNSGYRHLDLARVYGNEQEIGEGIQKAIDEGVVIRNDLFLTTKVWNNSHTRAAVKGSVYQSLSDLKTNYLDLVLIHWKSAFASADHGTPTKNNAIVYGLDSQKDEKGHSVMQQVSIQETWHALEELVDEGVVRSIGVSNFNESDMEEVLSFARIKPVVNQVEVHPYFPQHALRKWSRQHNIHTVAYSPLGNLQRTSGVHVNSSPLFDQVILDVAHKKHKSPAQVILRWSVQHGNIVIPKSANTHRLVENISIGDFELTHEEMSAIDLLGGRNIRYINPPFKANGAHYFPLAVPGVQFYNKQWFPVLGLGTWRSDKHEVGSTVELALQQGYNHFDLARIYQNENEIGRGFNFDKFPQRRQQIFITSKLWNNAHHPSHVEESVDISLKDLNTNYLDLLLIHWPVSLHYTGANDFFPQKDGRPWEEDVPLEDTWRAMEALVDNGKVRAIGVSNFSIEQLQRILNVARIKPVTNQIECHPYFPQLEMASFLKQNNMVLTSYSPLGNLQQQTGAYVNVTPLDDPVIVDIARHYNKSPAQVILAWHLAKGYVPLPKTVNASRLLENLLSIELVLEPQHIARIDELGAKNIRFVNPEFVHGKKIFPESNAKL